ncbi:MAG: hypothetical protein QFX36_00935 [Archaeoglobales archaeon]|nr:hypothetical protein [Archaeoglobales archaeon]
MASFDKLSIPQLLSRVKNKKTMENTKILIPCYNDSTFCGIFSLKEPCPILGLEKCIFAEEVDKNEIRRVSKVNKKD